MTELKIMHEKTHLKFQQWPHRGTWRDLGDDWPCCTPSGLGLYCPVSKDQAATKNGSKRKCKANISYPILSHPVPISVHILSHPIQNLLCKLYAVKWNLSKLTTKSCMQVRWDSSQRSAVSSGSSRRKQTSAGRSSVASIAHCSMAESRRGVIEEWKVRLFVFLPPPPPRPPLSK